MRAKFTTKEVVLVSAVSSDTGIVKQYRVDEAKSTGPSGQIRAVRLVWDEDVYYRADCTIARELERMAKSVINYQFKSSTLCALNTSVDYIINHYKLLRELATASEYAYMHKTGEQWFKFHGEPENYFDLL